MMRVEEQPRVSGVQESFEWLQDFFGNWEDAVVAPFNLTIPKNRISCFK